MSQATTVLPVSGVVSGLTFATDLNAALDALKTAFVGASAPSADTPTEGQFWLDTSFVGSGKFPILRQYDGSSWVAIAVIDTTNHQAWPNTGPLQTTTGTGAAYVLATTPYEPTTTPVKGFRVRCEIHTPNTGACTLAVNGGTAYPLRSSSLVDLSANTLSANMIVEADWAASEWLIVNAVSAIISNSAVTYAKIQNVTNARLLGNFSGGAAAPQEVALGTGLSVAGTTAPVINATVAANPPVGSFSGLSAIVTSSVATVVSGSIIISDSTTYRNVTLSNSTCNFTTSGAGGLDTGTFSAGLFYSLWAISDSTANSVLGSLSFTSPTMPAGYTYKARVGSVVTSTITAILYPTRQYGRTVQYGGSFLLGNAGRQLVTGSAATYTAIAVSNVVVPPTASEISLTFGGTIGNTNAAVAPSTFYGSAGNGPNPPPMWITGSGAGVGGAGMTGRILLESTNIYWGANGSISLGCIGWVDNL